MIVFVNADRTVEVTDLAGPPLRSQPHVLGIDPFALRRRGGHLRCHDRRRRTGGGQSGRLRGDDRTRSTATAASAATCGPRWTVFNPSGSNSWRLGSNAVVAQFRSPTKALHAYDLATGAPRWTAAGDFNDYIGLRVRGSQVFATQSFPATETDVFDLDGEQGCAGTPTVCAPVRRLPTTQQSVYDATIANRRVAISQATPIVNTNTATRSFALYAADGTGCTTDPALLTQPPRRSRRSTRATSCPRR